MDFMKMWSEYKKIIVVVGFGLGFTCALGVLPETIEFLGENTNVAYGALIAFSGFTFYKFYWNIKNTFKPVQSYQRYVEPRDLSNSGYTDDLLRSKGLDPRVVERVQPKQGVASEVDRVGQSRLSKDSDVFDKFKQDY